MPQVIGLYDVGGGQGKQHGTSGEMDMTNIITEALEAVGASGADWRVQAGGAVALILAGVGCGAFEWVRRKRKGKKNASTDSP